MSTPPTPHAVRAWRATWQGRVRVALNEANRAVKDWETAVRQGGLAAAGVGNAAIQEDSLPALPLGVLADLAPTLLPGAAAKLRDTGATHMALLLGALALAEGAAERAARAAASLAVPPAPGDPAGVPVFGVLSLPSLAGCFQRVAGALAVELVLKRAIAQEVAAVLEARQTRRMGGKGGGASATATPPSCLAGDALRSRFLVCVTAWKLQPEHRADAVTAELSGVAEEMKGY